MSQHDMDVANGPGATVRTDINAALQALASNSVGPLAPATTFPCQWWGDTTANKLKRRNIANSAWIDMGPLDSLSYLLASGGTMTGPINDATPQTIASATTTDIGASTSNVVYISGTTTITGLGTIAAGARRTVRFLGSLVLTHNVTSLILPGNASITTAANDTAEFLSLGSGNWICLDYTYRSNLVDMVTLYPNGGSVGSPANIALNSRIVMANPFPGYRVLCVVEILYNSEWSQTGWLYSSATAQSQGVAAGYYETGDAVVVQSGTGALMAVANIGGGLRGNAVATSTPLPVRLHVYKLKGAI